MDVRSIQLYLAYSPFNALICFGENKYSFLRVLIKLNVIQIYWRLALCPYSIISPLFYNATTDYTPLFNLKIWSRINVLNRNGFEIPKRIPVTFIFILYRHNKSKLAQKVCRNMVKTAWLRIYNNICIQFCTILYKYCIEREKLGYLYLSMDSENVLIKSNLCNY